MKKHIILFSSVLLLGVALTVGSEVNAESNLETPVELTTRVEKEDFYDVNGIGYKITNGDTKEVAIVTHRFNSLPERLVIPEKVTNSGNDYTVTSISEQGLSLHGEETDNVKSVTIPKTIKEIGRAAFYRRKALEQVTFSEGLISIGINGFRDTGVKSISLPSSLETIEDQAFMGSSSLVDVKIQNNVKIIGNAAFKDAASLKAIIIPNSVKTIGTEAFAGATSLNNVTLPTGLTALARSLFKDCSSLKTIKIPDTVSKISSEVFMGSGLTKLTMPTAIVKSTAFSGLALYGDFIEEITFTSPIVDGMPTNILKVPIKDGYTFDGWLGSDGETYAHSELTTPAMAGNITLTAKWKQGPVTPKPSTGTSDATIKLLERQPVGAVSFGSVSTDAAIVFNDITLNGSAQTTKENTSKTNAKVIVNDTRTDKTNGWKVEVQYGDTNFTSKNMKLELKPTSTSTPIVKNVTLTSGQQEIFNNGTAKNNSYSVLLNPELTIPKDFSAKNEQKTTVKWTLTSEV